MMRHLLAAIQSFQKWYLSNILIRNQIEGPNSSFATKDDGKVHVEEKSTDCIYCSEDQILDKCNAFMNETLKEMIKFLARKKICYGYLQLMEMGIMQSHAKKGCHVARKGTLHHYMATSL